MFKVHKMSIQTMTVEQLYKAIVELDGMIGVVQRTNPLDKVRLDNLIDIRDAYATEYNQRKAGGGRRRTGASVKTLKKALKKAGLKTTGRKAALTRRAKKAHLKY